MSTKKTRPTPEAAPTPPVPPAPEAVPYQNFFVDVDAAALAPTEPPPAPVRRPRAEIGAELVALQIAYHVTAAPDALKLLRACAEEFLETFR